MENRKLLGKSTRPLLWTIGILCILSLPFLVLAKLQVKGGQWVLFHHPEIKGSVVEAGTAQPIDGAVVAALWQLSELVSEGFGGYARVQVVQTDKEGNFLLPSWISFKPWKFYTVTQAYSPKIVIYKPGHKLYWSRTIEREGFPDDSTKTEEEKTRLKQEYSIQPAKLKEVYGDEERLENYRDWETIARFPGRHFSRKQFEVILSALEKDLLQLSEMNERKESLIMSHKSLREFWCGGTDK